MRKLEDLEEKFISSTIDIHEKKGLNVLSNILTNRKFLNFTEKGFYLKIDNDNIKLFLNQDTEDIASLNELNYYINRYIALIIDFIKYLENNSYILVLPLVGKETVENKTIGIEIEGEPGIETNFIIQSGKQEFIKYTNSIFIVKNNLIDLKDNSFIEVSHRKYLEERKDIKKQFEKTNIGLVITIIALIISTFFNIQNLYKDDDSVVQEIKIINDTIKISNAEQTLKNNGLNEKKFNQLIKSIKSIRVYQECCCDNESLK